ncbi:hypothetical protein Vadar_007159 [Vaccinium darrowii]|uniref:Uncharacterized protein n=1 Tax=Vaccinium darrowii TaxID=229202 RepID=A0ACB7X845_9ERIC|nr:hypothetical protein Vadar_007159 [Vaccinium darrowii]
MTVTVSSYASTVYAPTTPTWEPTYAREPLLPLISPMIVNNQALSPATVMSTLRMNAPLQLRRPHAPAFLTNNSFSKGGDGGDPPSCDGQYLSDDELIVALSTGWFSCGTRCNQIISIQATNGNSVKAKVVDECDSMHGCDKAKVVDEYVLR